MFGGGGGGGGLQNHAENTLTDNQCKQTYAIHCHSCGFLTVVEVVCEDGTWAHIASRNQMGRWLLTKLHKQQMDVELAVEGDIHSLTWRVTYCVTWRVTYCVT